MNITVFGGSQPQPSSPAYKQAYARGKLLALAGQPVLTGGCTGTEQLPDCVRVVHYFTHGILFEAALKIPMQEKEQWEVVKKPSNPTVESAR
jgi:predicted Rossmann-fold nucleotide-binding protein